MMKNKSYQVHKKDIRLNRSNGFSHLVINYNYIKIYNNTSLFGCYFCI